MTGRAGLLAILLFSANARAYVRTTTEKGGTPVHWPLSAVIVRPDSRGTPALSQADIEATLARATANWRERTGNCSYFDLGSRPASGPADLMPDGEPVLVFRNQAQAWRHSASILGLTTVFYVDAVGQPSDGEIIDADIELNAVNWTFVLQPSTVQPRPGTGIADLENTLTHELGHVQGLAHTCWDHVTPDPPLNDQGQRIPDCNASPLPPEITQATMYPYATRGGETSKRNPTADDLRGVCDVYPRTAVAPARYRELNGGCSVSGEHSASAGGLLMLGVLSLLAARGRRDPQRSSRT